MKHNPMYVEQSKRIYAQFQHYRKMRDICATINRLDFQHPFPDEEPFITLFTKLTENFRDNHLYSAVKTAKEIKEQWLRKVKYHL